MIRCYSDLVALVEIRNLVKTFSLSESPFGGRSSGEVRAVDDVSLDIYEGETLGLVGESGSGKSTLGRLVLRLIEPTSGGVIFDGVDLLGANAAEVRRLRRHMQIIFQDPFGSLDPRYRVEDVIAEPLLLHRELLQDDEEVVGERLNRDGRRQRVRELLRAVGMDESAMRRYPHEFSGGQRQRIGIARALALRPKFIGGRTGFRARCQRGGADCKSSTAVATRLRTHLFVYLAFHAGGSLSFDSHCSDVSRQDCGDREHGRDYFPAAA